MTLDQRELSRRGALAITALLSGGLTVSVGGLVIPAAAQNPKAQPNQAAEEEEKKDGHGAEPEVSATEDLMREHGVLRRTLIVYAETASMLRGRPGNVDLAALADAADSSARSGRIITNGYLKSNRFPRSASCRGYRRVSRSGAAPPTPAGPRDHRLYRARW